jgi:hypothetical protein
MITRDLRARACRNDSSGLKKQVRDARVHAAYWGEFILRRAMAARQLDRDCRHGAHTIDNLAARLMNSL